MTEHENLLPREGRIAGVDFGTVRIGLAISDPSQTWASPLETYTRRTEVLDAERFRQLARHEHLVGFVVGLPVHASGDESQKSKEARAFGKWLFETTELPVCFYDERYSTAHANQILEFTGASSSQRKKNRDKLAAQILLSGYLESNRSNETSGPL